SASERFAGLIELGVAHRCERRQPRDELARVDLLRDGDDVEPRQDVWVRRPRLRGPGRVEHLADVVRQLRGGGAALGELDDDPPTAWHAGPLWHVTVPAGA